MPELPDILVYVESLDRHLKSQILQKIQITSPFLLRSVRPRISEAQNKELLGFRRLGKRIVFELEDDLFFVFHLMVAGRFRLEKPDAPIPKKIGLARFLFERHTLVLVEASKKKRASLFVVQGEEGLADHDRGGIDVRNVDLEAFSTALTATNHTLKRALTDPRILDGIGNAYSDEILHTAELSPLKRTDRLSEEELERLYDATRSTLERFLSNMRAEVGDGFPKKVTAFRDDMAVHGKFKQPCPVCDTNVQRIVYAENETNYCPRCQNDGRILKDRSLSRLLKEDWPKTVDELER